MRLTLDRGTFRRDLAVTFTAALAAQVLLLHGLLPAVTPREIGPRAQSARALLTEHGTVEAAVAHLRSERERLYGRLDAGDLRPHEGRRVTETRRGRR